MFKIFTVLHSRHLSAIFFELSCCDLFRKKKIYFSTDSDCYMLHCNIRWERDERKIKEGGILRKRTQIL